jgi:hypothetical protein
MALSHVDGGRLTSHGRIVTAVRYSTLAFTFTSASRLSHDPEQAFQQASLPWSAPIERLGERWKLAQFVSG